MIEYLIFLIAIPLGFLLAKITKDEKEIYSQKLYFPAILWTLAITSPITYFIDKTTSLTLTFIFLTTFIWNKA
tara:strand:- start:9 stop:227 length:219 start_codon:yes stop_codon:yes gene_type:complete